MKIRLAKPEDFDYIYDIQQQLVLDSIDNIHTKEIWLKAQIKNETLFVADDDIIKGVMCLDTYGEVVNIRSLVVDKNYRKQGIGTKFIEFAKVFWKKKNVWVLHVGSFFEYKVLDFYLKCGFKKTGTGYYKKHGYYEFQMR